MADEPKRILVIEDDPDILRIMLHTLNNGGYRAVPGYGGEDALRKVRKGWFDLILTDLAMPGMSGVEIIDELKSDPETAKIPVVAVTAHVWEGIGRSAGELGCDGYLAKPFMPRQLLEVVARYIAAGATPRAE